MSRHISRLLSILCALLFATGVACAASLVVPTALKASLEDTIGQQEVNIQLIGEDGKLAENNVITLEFQFPTDKEEWSVSHTVGFAYSSNLLKEKSGVLSFDITPLQYDADNVVDTQVSLDTNNSNVSISEGKQFNVLFSSGFSGDVPLGYITITASKPASQKLAAGEYSGSISVNLTSSN